MLLSREQYEILFGARNITQRISGVIPPNAVGYPNGDAVMLWDMPVTEDSKRWGKCNSLNDKCVGVPYKLDGQDHADTFTGNQKKKIYQAMREIEESTCIRYFHIRAGHFCCSLKYHK